MTVSLYTVTDVKKVREQVLSEQAGCDALTGLIIPSGQAVLDHNHKTLKVRACIHRQVNAALGKIENIWTRYLAHWYPGTLSDFLRQAANYLEEDDDSRWYHPHWMKKIQTRFNCLKESQKNEILEVLQCKSCSNMKERREEFRKVVLDRNFGYDHLACIVETYANPKVKP